MVVENERDIVRSNDDDVDGVRPFHPSFKHELKHKHCGGTAHRGCRIKGAMWKSRVPDLSLADQHLPLSSPKIIDISSAL